MLRVYVCVICRTMKAWIDLSKILEVAKETNNLGTLSDLSDESDCELSNRSFSTISRIAKLQIGWRNYVA